MWEPGPSLEESARSCEWRYGRPRDLLPIKFQTILTSLHVLLCPLEGGVTDVDQAVEGTMNVRDSHQRQGDEQGEGKDLQGLQFHIFRAKRAGCDDRQDAAYQKHAPQHIRKPGAALQQPGESVLAQ